MAKMSADEVTFNVAEYAGSPLELECLDDLKTWVERDAVFYGRKDSEFLLIFIRGCKYNLDKAKKKLDKFYETRRKIPKWWCNRDLSNDRLTAIMSDGGFTVVGAEHTKGPVIAIIQISRFGKNPNDFDNYGKLASVCFEVMMRRTDFQLQGIVWIADMIEVPQWFFKRILNPRVAKNMVYSFYQAIPARIKTIILLNCTPLTVAFYALVKPFFSKKLRKRVHLYETGWSNVVKHVPLEMLPNEFGGQAGQQEFFRECFVKDMFALNDYLIEDSKYGYQSIYED